MRLCTHALMSETYLDWDFQINAQKIDICWQRTYRDIIQQISNFYIFQYWHFTGGMVQCMFMDDLK